MDIQSLISQYKPSKEAISLLQTTNAVILCGITAAGKNAIQDKLLEGGGYTRIITSTTRLPRENNGIIEQDGREYYFFTQEQAVEKIQQQKYFEVAYVHEKINGITLDEIRRVHDSGKIALTNIDYQGIEYFHAHAPSVLAIFVVPPNYEVWHSRMKNRYDTDANFLQALPTRMNSAVKELEWALATDYLYFVVNDQLDVAVRDIEAVITNPAKSSEGRLQAQELLRHMDQLAL